MKISSLITKIVLKLSEEKFGENQIKYIYKEDNKSEELVVVFSGFSGKGIPARYNYFKTLERQRVNKLFILDDFGYNNAGAYYLIGREGKGNTIQKEICSLIKKHGAEKQLICVGSSKGGTAALMYGIMCNASKVIIGAPQYHIGNYLNCNEHREIFLSINNNCNELTVERLNNIVKDTIFSSVNKDTEIYLHASPNEHTFDEHVIDLVKDLSKCGFTIFRDFDYTYSEHGQVAKFFPEYLIKTLQKILEEKI